MNLSKLREMLKDREAWRATVHGVTKFRLDIATEQMIWTQDGFPFLSHTFSCSLPATARGLPYQAIVLGTFAQHLKAFASERKSMQVGLFWLSSPWGLTLRLRCSYTTFSLFHEPRMEACEEKPEDDNSCCVCSSPASGFLHPHIVPNSASSNSLKKKKISQIPCIHCVVAPSSSYALAQMNQCLILLVFRPADCRITQAPWWAHKFL